MDATTVRREIFRIEKRALEARRACEAADLAVGPNEDRDAAWEALGCVVGLASALSSAVAEIARLRAELVPVPPPAASLPPGQVPVVAPVLSCPPVPSASALLVASSASAFCWGCGSGPCAVPSSFDPCEDSLPCVL